MSDDIQAGSGSRWPTAVRLSEAHADLLRMRILAQCNLRETSPQQFHAEYGGATLPKVRRAFELLAQYGWLKQTRTEGEGRDSEEVERFYAGTGFPIFDEETFQELPDAIQAMIVGRVVETLHVRSKEALKAGTMTGRPDHHLTCTPLELDQQGWDEMISRVNSVFNWLLEEFDAARGRLAESGEEPIPVTVGLLAFESPPRPVKPR